MCWTTRGSAARTRGRQGPLALALALMTAASAPASAEKLSPAGTEAGGFGRIVLTFEQPTKTTARVTNGVLVLSFAEPVTLAREKLATELPSYVAMVRLDPDGKALRLALSRPVRLNVMEAGERLFVDLLPAKYAGVTPGLPQEVVDELAQRARAAEAALKEEKNAPPKIEIKPVTFRVGTLPTLTRLVLTPPKGVPVSFRQEDDRAVVEFAGPVSIERTRLKAALGAAVLSVESESDEQGLKLVLNIGADTKLQGFAEDDAFVVDIAKAPEKKTGEAGQPDLLQELGKPAGERPPDQPRSGERAGAEAPNGEGRTNAKADKGDKSAKTDGGKAAGASEPRPAGNASALAALGAVKAQAEPLGNGVKISFPFQTRSAAAAFERDGIVTLIFESAETLDRSSINALNGGPVLFTEATRRGPLNILRFTMAQRAFTRLSPVGQAWVLTLGDESLAETLPLALERSFDNKGKSTVDISIKDTAGIHWIEGAAPGERIAVVTAFAPARGLPKPQRFVEFEALQSAQGIAVVALSDDIIVKPGIEKITISTAGGLLVSQAIEPEGESERPTPVGMGTTFVVDRQTWLSERRGIVREGAWARAAAVAAARPSERVEARFVLARFLSANDLASEAKGVLETIAADDPKGAASRPIALLRGIVAFQMNRLGEARALLAAPSLADDPEATLWRAAVDARTLRWREALSGFRRSTDVLEAYPEYWQGPLRALAVRAALILNQVDYAEREADFLAQLPGTIPKEETALLRARLDEAAGKFDEALAGYRAVAEAGDPRPLAAEAALHATTLALRRKAINSEQAIGALESLSVIWRGDDLEARVLGQLGQLYAETGQWRKAFMTARIANQHFSDNPVTRNLHEDMARRFEDLFLTEQTNSLGRLESLALYYDFNEFTPIGRHGDEIIRRLAERLADLDLLEQAGDLLQHQVDNRLTGAARATVAAKLASLRLVAGKPAQALQVLQDTRLPELPGEIKRARLLLEARSLSDLSRTDLALELLEDESGPEIARLKADILWQARRWREAGEAHELMLGDRWQGSQALTDAERNDVMRAGIAYALASELLSLDRLRSKYAAKMANSPDAKTFAFLTGPSARSSQTFRDMARNAVNTDTLGDFLTEYRKRYPDAAIAARNRKSEVGRQKSDAGNQRSDVGNQRSGS
jgi:hypothetical protein